jgi:hypothetical protein
MRIMQKKLDSTNGESTGLFEKKALEFQITSSCRALKHSAIKDSSLETAQHPNQQFQSLTEQNTKQIPSQQI